LPVRVTDSGGAQALICLPLAASLLDWQSGFRSGANTLVADVPLAAPMPASCRHAARTSVRAG
jgi:hypothetical protein